MPYISTISRAAANGLGYRGAEPAIGSPFQGGYYAGAYQVNGAKYYLIVAPKASESTTTYWTGLAPNVQTTSEIDGLANTNSLSSGGQAPAAFYCFLYQNDGYTDWYLPALLEIEIIYYNLKSFAYPNSLTTGANQYAIPSRAGQNYKQFIPRQTPVGLFQSGGTQFLEGIYWTSTQFSPTGQNAKAFGVLSADGIVYQVNKAAPVTAIVRPVRKVYAGTV